MLDSWEYISSFQRSFFKDTLKPAAMNIDRRTKEMTLKEFLDKTMSRPLTMV
jgi:hypothetical protein